MSIVLANQKGQAHLIFVLAVQPSALAIGPLMTISAAGIEQNKQPLFFAERAIPSPAACYSLKQDP
jgi:hypothetical protein